jgi:penicillin-binding protein 1C
MKRLRGLKIKTKHACIALLVLLLALFWFSISFPLFKKPYSTVIYSKNNHLLGAHIAQDGQWRFPQGDSVPDKFKTCIIQFEDEYFFQHPGVNFLSLARAFKQNISQGEIVSGGSTLTMQLIRMSTGHKRTFFNKLIEIFQSLRIELSLSKEEILSLYATYAPFGGNVVGLEAASWRYFHRPPYSLSWAENATLAVLPNAPGLIHTGKNRTLLLHKRNRLLHKLWTQALIDSTTYSLAITEPIPDHPYPLPQAATHLLDYCRKTKEGASYYLNLDDHIQEQAKKTLAYHHAKLHLNEIHNACAIIVEVSTGNVLAYVGNTSSLNKIAHHNQVDIIQSPRSTGSILKPFLYAAALQDGKLLPNTLVKDIPTYFKNFAPKNYNRTFSGAVPANEALSRSLNVPAVNMLKDYGIDRFCTILQKAGLTTITSAPDYYGLSLILGGAEAKLFDLSGAYASMARTLNDYTQNNSTYFENAFHAPYIFKQQRSKRKEPTEFHPVFSAGAIYHTFEALTNVVRPSEEMGWQAFSSSRKIAWKTGTSFGYRDAWAIGITPEYVVAVWVGNASGEGRPGIVGGSTAGPLMFDLFNHLPHTTWFKPPYDDMVKTAVCKQSGYKAGPYCDTDSLYIPVQGQKTMPCPYHQLIHLNQEQTHRVNSDCYPIAKMVHRNWFVLPPVMEWYYRKNNPLYKKLPPYQKDCQTEQNVMEFIYPQNNARLFLPIGLDGDVQSVILKVVHRNPSTTIYWHIDKEYIGQTSFVHQMSIQPTPGWHQITLTDSEGNMLSKRIHCVGRGDLSN